MRKAIAIDLGGTQIRAALVEESGHIINRVAMPTPVSAGPDAVVEALALAAKEIAEGAGDVAGICLASPGPVDTISGIIYRVYTLGFDHYPLREALSEKLGRAVLLENDGIAAAIGEWTYGAGKGHNSVVYVTASTGIGGGAIVDGQVLRGRMGMAGHVGHLCIDHKGPRCGCGNTGCWEAFAAGPIFAERAQRAAAADGTSSLGTIATPLKPADIFAAAATGDALARALVEDEARYLGIGMTSLLHLYSPDVIVLGGGMSNAFAQLHPGITAYIQDNAQPAFRAVPVVKAACGDNSGLMGAAAMVFEQRASA